MVGNAAVDQLQLSVFGDVFDMVRLYVDHGHVLDAGTGRLLAGLADRACDVWRHRDAGLWELPRQEHYTSSKLSCWQALRCADHLARMGQIPGDPARWASEAERIARWVHEHCWSDGRGAFTWYPGTDELDTSILLHAGSGFDVGPRMSSTIDALRAELGAGPLLYRYTGAAKEEAAFVAPSFWAVSALHAVGRTVQARTLMDELVPLANDVGVLAGDDRPGGRRVPGQPAAGAEPPRPDRGGAGPRGGAGGRPRGPGPRRLTPVAPRSRRRTPGATVTPHTTSAPAGRRARPARPGVQ